MPFRTSLSRTSEPSLSDTHQPVGVAALHLGLVYAAGTRHIINRNQ